jgi:hypothetical protein
MSDQVANLLEESGAWQKEKAALVSQNAKLLQENANLVQRQAGQIRPRRLALGDSNDGLTEEQLLSPKYVQ